MRGGQSRHGTPSAGTINMRGASAARGSLEPISEATFSNLLPGTSDAEAMGGNSSRIIWGTNISIQDSMNSFKSFLYSFEKKYRMWADGALEDETHLLGDLAKEKEYITMLNDMRRLGVTGLNLDIRNLKAYPPTLKLWHQVQQYPQEIIPIMDQTVKDVMLELAANEMDSMRIQTRQRSESTARVRESSPLNLAPSSEFPNPTSEIGHEEERIEIPNLYAEIEAKTYKVLPFGLDQSVNMRDLNPKGMSRLISSHTVLLLLTFCASPMQTWTN